MDNHSHVDIPIKFSIKTNQPIITMLLHCKIKTSLHIHVDNRQ